MQLLKRLIIIISAMLIPIYVFSEPNASSTQTHFLTFQVIQDEFVLDNTTVKQAAIIENSGVYKGLNVELKPEPAKIFTEITKAGIGRKLNLVFNKVVVTVVTIQSELSGNFLIKGISKQDAQAFLNMLNMNKK